MAEAAGKPILCCSCYAEGRSSEKLEVAPPSPGQLRHVFFHNALPFVGFGFLDNAIMIAAGTQIELSIGVVLGISTMAAAALGNLVSDLAGLGLAGYVEALASRLGLSIPDLTPKQADMWQTRLSAHLSNDKASNDCEKCQCRLEVMSCISRMQLELAGAKKPLQGWQGLQEKLCALEGCRGEV
uniref:Transmembrane protein 65 n=1 Tax=Cyanistes caeruleus TaxID=156563 RepID=A0A8C0ZBE0_CYACU